jgi:hypothetical protein
MFLEQILELARQGHTACAGQPFDNAQGRPLDWARGRRCYRHVLLDEKTPGAWCC